MESSHNINEEAFQRIVNKAAWLLAEGRVTKISDVMFYVMGRKNRHIVKVENDQLTCTCPGFKEKNICSHIVAVSVFLGLKDKAKLIDERVRIRVEKELRNLGRWSFR